MAKTEFPAGTLDHIGFVVIFAHYQGKWVYCSLKELLVFFVLIKVKIGSILIITSAKLFEDLGFSNLPDAFQDQRFPVRGIFPGQQFFQDQSFHTNLHHIFIKIYV